MIGLDKLVSSILLIEILACSHAFVPNAQRGSRIQSCLNAESSSALHYRQGGDNEWSTSSILYATTTAATYDDILCSSVGFNSEHEIERRIEEALVNARNMDRQYGLCTHPSILAWKLVDELYTMSAASQQVEDNVKRVLGGEKSIWSLYK